MFSPSDYNDAVPQFTNGNYANTPLNPLYIEEPGAVDYNRGMEPVQTLPAQWWNWLCNQFTAKLNKLNIYVKNIFDELTQLLSVVGITPDATEESITTGQLKGMFQTSYPQFMYDNFKFESLLQGRTRGVMLAPTDTWDNDTNTLSLTGGFGILNTYKKVSFATSSLILPNDAQTHYIVSDTAGVITIEDTLEDDVILVGLCHDKEYCLLIDNDVKQCKENIILHKWFGQNKLTNGFVTVLQTYYNTAISSISTSVIIISKNDNGIDGVVFDKSFITINEIGEASAKGIGFTSCTLNNCTINISDIIYNNSTRGFVSCIINNCTINITTFTKGRGLENCTLNECIVNADTVGANLSFSSNCNNCRININTANSTCINNGNLFGCIISVGTITSGYALAGSSGDVSNCTVRINTVNGGGIASYDYCRIANCYFYADTIKATIQYSGAVGMGYALNCSFCLQNLQGGTFIHSGRYQNCTIKVVNSTGGTTITSSTSIWFHFVHAELPSVPTISSVNGKAVIINETTVKGL